jgi:integrase
MRVRLRGLNSTTKRLADGTVRTYWYAWKGGPALKGEPGSPEFVQSYNEAIASRKTTAGAKTLQSLINYFQTTTEFTHGISPRTRADYLKQIVVIEKKWGDFPTSGLTDKRARGLFMEWRDELAQRSARQADYAWTVLARILSVALKRGKIDANPCVAGERLYRSRYKVWSEEDEAAFLGSAPPHLHLPLLLALWTGQREGDLLRLSWSAYDGSVIRLRPRKTITRKSPQGRTVIIPVGVLAQEATGEASPLKSALDAAARGKKSPIVLLTSEGRPWTEGGFRASFNKARDKAGVAGLTFHDLRGTAVTRLALMGVEVPEIAAITGHSLKDVHAILDAHYLHRDPKLAWNAIRKLEMGYARKPAAAGTA